MLGLILATWRLTSLLHREHGPAHLFERWRYRLGVRYDVHSEPYATTNLAEGVLCFWCCSMWAALILTLPLSRGAGTWVTRWRAWLGQALAASAGAIVVEEWFNGNTH